MESDTRVLDDRRAASPPPKPCPPLLARWGPSGDRAGLAAATRSSARRPAWPRQCGGPGVSGGPDSATQTGRGPLLPETPELQGDSGPQRCAPATCPLTRIEAGIEGSPFGQKGAPGPPDGSKRLPSGIRACRACRALPALPPPPRAGAQQRGGRAGAQSPAEPAAGGRKRGPSGCREGWTS